MAEANAVLGSVEEVHDKKVAIHREDRTARVRTLLPFLERPWQRTLKETDPGNASSSLRRGFLRSSDSEAAGYVEVDAATALSLICHARRDWTNFARILAAEPAIIDVLLDSNRIGHGEVFNDQNVWPLLARVAIRLRALGGSTSLMYQSLTLAIENYLAFYGPEGPQGPMLKAQKRPTCRVRRTLTH